MMADPAWPEFAQLLPTRKSVLGIPPTKDIVARASISRYLGFYNSRRHHSSLDRKAPDQAYFNQLLLPVAA